MCQSVGPDRNVSGIVGCVAIKFGSHIHGYQRMESIDSNNPLTLLQAPKFSFILKYLKNPFNGLPGSFVQTFMVPRGFTVITFSHLQPSSRKMLFSTLVHN